MNGKLLLCLLAVGFTLYALVEEQNRLTELRLAIPALNQEVLVLEEEIRRLEYTVESCENPARLLELAQSPSFQHLKFPERTAVVLLPRGEPLSKP